jgi:hypothetical protein
VVRSSQGGTDETVPNKSAAGGGDEIVAELAAGRCDFEAPTFS